MHRYRIYRQPSKAAFFVTKKYPYKEKAEAKSLGFFSYKTGGTKDGSDQI